MISRAAKRAILSGTAALAAFCAWPVAFAQVGQFSQEQRGHYLVDAGDCVACHTAEGGKPFAGGRHQRDLAL